MADIAEVNAFGLPVRPAKQLLGSNKTNEQLQMEREADLALRSGAVARSFTATGLSNDAGALYRDALAAEQAGNLPLAADLKNASMQLNQRASVANPGAREFTDFLPGGEANLSEIPAYIGGNIGMAGRSMAAPIAAGAAGAVAGGMVGGPVGATVGGALGAFGAGANMNMNEMAGGIAADPVASAQAPNLQSDAIRNYGLGMGAIDALVPFKMGSTLAKPLTGQMVKKSAKDILTGIPVTMGQEGITEGAQRVVQDVGVGTLNPAHQIDWKGALNEGVAGMTGAGPFAGAHAGVEALQSGAAATGEAVGGVADSAKSRATQIYERLVEAAGDDPASPLKDIATKLKADLDAAAAGGVEELYVRAEDAALKAASNLLDKAKAVKDTAVANYDEYTARQEALKPFKDDMEEISRAASKNEIKPEMRDRINRVWDAANAANSGLKMSKGVERQFTTLKSDYPDPAEYDAQLTILKARTLRGMRHAEGAKKAEETLADMFAKTSKAKKSLLDLGSSERNVLNDVNESDEVKVGISSLEKAVTQAFSETGRDTVEDQRDLDKSIDYVKMVTREALKGATGKSEQKHIEQLLRDYLTDQLNEDHANHLMAMVREQISKTYKSNKARKADKQHALYDKQSAWEFIKKNVKPSGKGEVYDFSAVIKAVEAHDDKYLKLKRNSTTKVDFLEEELAKINDELRYSIRKLTNDNMLSGNLNLIIMAAREINHSGLSKSMPQYGKRHVLDQDTLSQMDPDELANLEYDLTGDPDEENASDINVSDEPIPTPSGWTNVPEYDKLPVTGWQTPDNPAIGGAIGSAKLALSKKAEAMSNRAADGKKPSKQTGGYIELGQEYAQQRAARVAKEEGRKYKEVLQEYAEAVREADAKNAEEWGNKLLEEGVPLGDMIQFLVSEASTAFNERMEAKTEGKVQKTFDGKKLLMDTYGVDEKTALAVESTFWAVQRGKFLAKEGAETFFEKFSHAFPMVRNQGGSHEMLSHIDVNQSMIRAKDLPARTKEGDIDPQHGYLPVTFAGQKLNQYLDLNVLMRKSVARVRNRTEQKTTDEGRWDDTEQFDATLRDDKGNLNMEYVEALRSGLGNLMVSLSQDLSGIDIKSYDLDELTNPSTLLIRGTKGVGDIRVGDILPRTTFSDTSGVDVTTLTPESAAVRKAAVKAVKDDEHSTQDARKLVATEKKLRAAGVLRNVKPGERGKQSDALQKGDVVRLNDGSGNPVVLNMPALVKMMAKQLGYDLSNNPSRDALVYLAGAGVKSLSDAGTIKTEQGGAVTLFKYDPKGKRYAMGDQFVDVFSTNGEGPFLFERKYHSVPIEVVADPNKHEEADGAVRMDSTLRTDRVVMNTHDLKSPYIRDPAVLDSRTEIAVKLKALLAVLRKHVEEDRRKPENDVVYGAKEKAEASAAGATLSTRERQLKTVLTKMQTTPTDTPSFNDYLNQAHDIKNDIVNLKEIIDKAYAVVVERDPMPDIYARAIRLKKMQRQLVGMKAGPERQALQAEILKLGKVVGDDNRNIESAKVRNQAEHDAKKPETKIKTRDDLALKEWDDLVAMLENVTQAYEDQTGQEDTVFVAGEDEAPASEVRSAHEAAKLAKLTPPDRIPGTLEKEDLPAARAAMADKPGRVRKERVESAGAPADNRPVPKQEPAPEPKRGKAALDTRMYVKSKADRAWDAFVASKVKEFVPDDGKRFSILDTANQLYTGSSEEVAAVEKLIDHLFGSNKVDVKLDDLLGTIGEFDPDKLSIGGKLLIQLRMAGGGGLLSTTFHEAVHVLAHILSKTEAGKAAWEKLDKGINTPMMHARIERALVKGGVKNVAAIMDDVRNSPEEAVAYAFQLQQMGALTLGPETQGVMARIARFFRKLLNITNEAVRSEEFMKAFVTGKLARADFKQSALEAAFGETRMDKVMENIGDAGKPIMTLIHTIFDSSVQALDRLGPRGKELNALYAGYGPHDGYVHHVIVQSRRFGSMAQRVFDDYSEEEVRTGFRQLLAGDTKLNEAGQKLKQVIDAINKYSGKPEGHLPNVWDYEKIGKNREAFDAALRDFGDVSDDNKIKDQAVIDILRDMGLYDYTTEGKSKFDFLPQYAGEKANWVQNDPKQFMRSMIVSSVRGHEKSKISKRVGITLDLLEKEHGKEARYKAEQVIDGYEGKLGQNMDMGVRRLMHAALMVGNIVTLPLAIFSATVDPMHIVSRTGGDIGAAADAYARGIASIPNTIMEMFGGKVRADEMTRFAEDIGAIEHAMFTDLLGDIHLGDTAMGFTKKANDWFFRANMLDGWTRQMRVAAVAAGQRFIIAHAEGKGKHSAHYLEELGLTADDVKVVDGKLDANDPKIRMALNKFVDESVVRPDSTTNAVWMNDPRFALVAHMKRFTFAFNDKVLNRVVNEMGRGNASPLLPLMASIPIILAADMGKHLLKMDYSTWMQGASFTQWLGYGAERAGLTGKFQFGLDAGYDVQAGGTPLDSFLGPEFGMVKRLMGHERGTGQGELGLLGLMDDVFYLERAFKLGKGFNDATQPGQKTGTAKASRYDPYEDQAKRRKAEKEAEKPLVITPRMRAEAKKRQEEEDRRHQETTGERY